MLDIVYVIGTSIMRKCSKILHVIPGLGCGGAERQLVELVKALDKSLYESVICCLKYRGDRADEAEDNGIRVISLAEHRWGYLGTVITLARLYATEQPDIVHAWLFTGNTYSRLAALLSGTSPVLIAAERQVEDWKKGPYLWLDNLLAPFTDLILANSEAVRAFVKRTVRLRSGQCQVIYNGLDLARFDAGRAEAEVQRVREELGLEGGTLVVGTVANLTPHKNYPNFLQAAQRVKAAQPGVRFVIVGEGPLREELEQMADRLGLGNDVLFLGRRMDVPVLMSLFNVFVLASDREGFANVILEAMAAGKPVVATDVGGNAEAILEGQTGFLVPPGDPQALAEAIVRLLKDKDLAREMGERGRRRVEREFTLARMVQQTEAVYETLLRQKGVQV